ncbi:hypothetical protein PGT21_011154 [Puccinia graminis f. sp. tritici]|uniref:Uncharacterized protein n=1 Tax=Puccinia graminis f. sp. tritici TaxID=56615 RepID=A0A5B0QN35_PUCGR|nr:hypothetical protein PGT21_011462 [Puccinia graminis f. sp. tritici]KAA1114493.1 hypothetical protein PGT21_011154 [Puccinia graminis f. sp. tritici]KAA1124227.1 hypothetical protein PGTUg99_012640 [Puccinia graminis f. sp. tritici]KAA1124970.1 hypothetical protein PGTUg99_002327 [Puccinia graminis f. sp. tritici]KAA1127744.1 hypothetical protein PGTUg99_001226 [Puccinia graminis f. sp. tritici]
MLLSTLTGNLGKSKRDESTSMMHSTSIIRRSVEPCGPRSLHNSESRSSTRESPSILIKGFDLPFLRRDIIIDPSLETHEEFAKKWKTPDYYAPYAALIGSSMCGKGRLPPTIQPRLEELIDVEPDFVLLKSNANGKGYSKFGKPHHNHAENPESPYTSFYDIKSYETPHRTKRAFPGPYRCGSK